MECGKYIILCAVVNPGKRDRSGRKLFCMSVKLEESVKVKTIDSLQGVSMDPSIAYDFLLTGADIVTMDPERRILKNGSLGITGDRITFLGQEADPAITARASA